MQLYLSSCWSKCSHVAALLGHPAGEQPRPGRMAPKKNPPWGHRQQRATWAQPWYCRFCRAPRSGERWWNAADLTSCRMCQRSKGSCIHSNRVPGQSSVSTKDTSAGAEVRKLQDEFKHTQALLSKVKEAAQAKCADPFGMEGDYGPDTEAVTVGSQAKELCQLIDAF